MASGKIFIDGSVLYAFVDRADPNHVQASKTIEQLSLQGMHLFTSIQAVQDAHTAISRQLGQNLSIDFLQALVESTMEIIYPQKADFLSAFRLLKLNRSKEVNLKEALTAVMMQRKSIGYIFTFTYWQNLLGSTSYLMKI